MTDRFNKYKKGDWIIFCDICGQKCFASETVKLDTYTGRGGLIVCKNDADEIDPGLIPYRIPVEQNVSWTRINHTNVDDSSPIFNIEEDTLENIGSYEYLATDSDEVLIDDDEIIWIAI